MKGKQTFTPRFSTSSFCRYLSLKSAFSPLRWKERKKRVKKKKKKKEFTVTPSLLVFQFSQSPRLSQLNTNNTNNAVIYLSSSRFSGLHLSISNRSRTRFGSVTHPVGKYEATRLITDLCVFSRGVCGLILARHLTINM